MTRYWEVCGKHLWGILVTACLLFLSSAQCVSVCTARKCRGRVRVKRQGKGIMGQRQERWFGVSRGHGMAGCLTRSAWMEDVRVEVWTSRSALSLWTS